MTPLFACLFLAALTAPCLATSIQQQSRTVLKSLGKCPSSVNLGQLEVVLSVQDMGICAVSCTNSHRCSVVHLSGSVCYHGNDIQLATLWDQLTVNGSDGCVSYVKISSVVEAAQETAQNTPTTTGVIPITTATVPAILGTSIGMPTTDGTATSTPVGTESTPAGTMSTTAEAATTTAGTTPTTAGTTPTTAGTTPITAGTTPTTAGTTPTTATTAPTTTPLGPIGLSPNVTSKLLLLFDFRQSYLNLVNLSRFAASPRGSVSRNSQGAHFPGGNGNYIEVDTSNGTLASANLDHPNNFTFYARAVRNSLYGSMQTYHYFYPCSTLGHSGRFGDRLGHLWTEHAFPSQTAYPNNVETRQSTATPLVTGDAPQMVSAGAVFVGRSLQSFYLNGSMVATDSDWAWGINSQLACLRLGFDTDSNAMLRGSMICYAIAKAALGLADLQSLEAFCS